MLTGSIYHKPDHGELSVLSSFLNVRADILPSKAVIFLAIFGLSSLMHTFHAFSGPYRWMVVMVIGRFSDVAPALPFASSRQLIPLSL